MLTECLRGRRLDFHEVVSVDPKEGRSRTADSKIEASPEQTVTCSAHAVNVHPELHYHNVVFSGRSESGRWGNWEYT